MVYYIDLFCGIGGFHQAINEILKEKNINGKCLFAADVDEYASRMYEENYGIECKYDLKEKETHKILDNRLKGKELTFLFGGFPCQPFSKAGNQEGFGDKIKGTLFFEIINIVQKHKPKYILLENVRNLSKHDGGNTWKIIKESLINCGYIVDYVIISPNEIENERIPALRERIFILCYRNDLNIIQDKFFNGIKKPQNKTSIYKYNNIKNGLKNKYFEVGSQSDLEMSKIKTIDMWNDLYKMLKENNKSIISPLWPHYFNCDIENCDEPDWKKTIIKRNMTFYKENSLIYNSWYKKHKEYFDSLSRSDQKFEWNAGEDISDIWEGIIQFRPSGVRVKKPDFIPTLVAINQRPIIGVEKRYLKPTEMARLYGFKNLKFTDQLPKETYKQLGNTVSVDVVKYLIRHMLDSTTK